MFIIGYLFQALGNLLHFVINVYIFLIIIHSILSWVSVPRNKFVTTLNSLVEPFLIKIREVFPFGLIGGVDLTPLIGILLLYFVNEFFVNILLRIGHSLI
ncbi:MAG: YggT family protein [Candidatus Marinimicrobia bacterium]|nr:YggT family protein [Candidatus Neomarinimicrobiota bacterium]